ncbi:MAG TPA: thiamine phosphate synthase [Terriglobales bacterium]|nr:thiamine phosphate synthase [Terriglobales bacterium]
MQLYYITDRKQFPGGESAQRRQLLEKIAESAHYGIDYVQLREKDLTTHDLELLARDAVAARQPVNSRTKLLINSRTDVAMAVGADGVHLRGEDVSPEVVRAICCGVGALARVIVAISCHSVDDVARAASRGADFCVFGPVFEKQGSTPSGLDALREVCHEKVPVLALGGVTLANTAACLSAGAAGIAGIRLFQDNDLSQLIPKLRAQRVASSDV